LRPVASLGPAPLTKLAVSNDRAGIGTERRDGTRNARNVNALTDIMASSTRASSTRASSTRASSTRASSTRASSRRASARDLHCSRSDFFMVSASSVGQKAELLQKFRAVI
jgi:hypothetical protein